ncbi:hypothetical protein GH714_034747 [Hevea brasiliensis]|uniref:Transcription repressor n=1 Tax=Hevea brasiliensis TaxID=3981 RepID=A0A6A6NAY8_HEVBR|nr:hypothetical protein GH714_034693 [Hevea brasiliensis]KAF2323341.1 hypothetical protein GH714_034747 [Hevea brasiliensis]
MPTKLQKSLLAYLSKIKNPTPPNSLSSSKNWVLSGCKNPKTPSFAADRSLNEGHERDGVATLSDIDRFLFENFKGPHGVLYHDHYDSPRFFEITPDLCGSHQFFVTTGSSSLLIEEARLSLTVTSEEGESSLSSTSNTIIDSARSCSNSTDIKNINVALPDDCITVIKYSRSPNEDFQLSMQEMVEARLQRKGKVDWDFMQELLFCYLDLNEKKSHKFILSASVDLVVGLRQSSGEVLAKPRSSCRIGRERRGN